MALPGFTFTTWIPALVFESLLCIFMLYKGWRLYKNHQDAPMLKLLIQDRCLIFSSGRCCESNYPKSVLYYLTWGSQRFLWFAVDHSAEQYLYHRVCQLSHLDAWACHTARSCCLVSYCSGADSLSMLVTYCLSWAIVMPCVLGSRLLLEMRERCLRGQALSRADSLSMEMAPGRLACFTHGTSCSTPPLDTGGLPITGSSGQLV